MAVDGGAREDLRSHENTYSRFISMSKIATAVCMVVAAVVILLIAS